MGMGIACFGNQVVTTTCYTYSIDCYRLEASEISTFYNFIRQEVGMTFAFYAIPMADLIGFQFLFIFFACMGSILAFIPIVVLMFKGESIRKKLGKPTNVNVFDNETMGDRDGATEKDEKMLEVARTNSA
jgi:hypothetical protein